MSSLQVAFGPALRDTRSNVLQARLDRKQEPPAEHEPAAWAEMDEDPDMINHGPQQDLNPHEVENVDLLFAPIPTHVVEGACELLWIVFYDDVLYNIKLKWNTEVSPETGFNAPVHDGALSLHIAAFAEQREPYFDSVSATLTWQHGWHGGKIEFNETRPIPPERRQVVRDRLAALFRRFADHLPDMD